ncbi:MULTISPECIES: hypothetical protein [Amycolatopsis]|uniref:Integration host factor n=1 Tax=Amycolatopsis albidoflavus TaxID=102226 RepID=A0ABW5IG20_9PSEU
MATTDEEIERRVEENDAPRTAERKAAAKRVRQLARQRAEAAEKLADVERELGDVLAESSDVIGVEELAKFTDVPAADLNQWLNGRRTTRPKRKRTTANSSAAKDHANHTPPTATTAATGQPSKQAELASSRTVEGTAVRIPEPVT